MQSRTLLVCSLVALLAILLMSCSLGGGGISRITPTPTKTPRPLFTATLTSTASPVPTNTPLPTNTEVPTDTPVPPTDTPVPTDTPLPTEVVAAPTEPPVSSDTPVPPTSTPAPPTNTPRPAATNTPAPPPNTPKPKVDFVVKEIVAFPDPDIGPTGFHNVYFTVVDAGGTPLDGIILEEVNNQPTAQTVSGDKGPGRADFEMLASDYRFKVVGNTSGQSFASETTHVLSIAFGHWDPNDLIRGGMCTDEASCRALGSGVYSFHFSYNVTFQRTW